MTDEDRYARKLGKAFEGLRAILCSLETQSEAPSRAARYIVNQLAKDIDIKLLFRRAAKAIDSKHSFFEDTEALAEIERATSDTLGAEHFAESMRDVLHRGERSDRVLEHLARRSVDGTCDMILLERSYRSDTDCQAAFIRHDRGIYDEVVGQLRSRCGLEAKPTPAVARGNQGALLEFVVARDE